jgi:hypothetical protein
MKYNESGGMVDSTTLFNRAVQRFTLNRTAMEVAVLFLATEDSKS